MDHEVQPGLTRRSRSNLLRPVFPEDVPFLYFLVSEPGVASTWRFQGAVPDPRVFAETYQTGIHSQFVACRLSGEAIGHVVCYSADDRNATAYFGGAFVPSVQRTGTTMEAMLLFLQYLFTTQPFRKLYAEMMEPTFLTVRSGESVLFTREGLLSQHWFWNGHFTDVHLLAFWREPVLQALATRYRSLFSPR